jgi:hypothetical protein
MTESEKQSMYKANCKACLLAQAMKVCHLCQFNIGLSSGMQETTVNPSSAEVNKES